MYIYIQQGCIKLIKSDSKDLTLQQIFKMNKKLKRVAFNKRINKWK